MVYTCKKYNYHQERYLPWAILVLHLLTGQSILAYLAGIFIGHTLYFLKDELPPRGYMDVLSTPFILYYS